MKAGKSVVLFKSFVFAIFLLTCDLFARAQAAPICDVTCTPDTTQSSYAGASTARPKPLNARGYSSPTVAQAPLHAAAAAASSNTTLPGSQSYNYTIPILSLPGRAGWTLY